MIDEAKLERRLIALENVYSYLSEQRRTPANFQWPDIDISVSETGLVHISSPMWDYYVKPGSAVKIVAERAGYLKLPYPTGVSFREAEEVTNAENIVDRDPAG